MRAHPVKQPLINDAVDAETTMPATIPEARQHHALRGEQLRTPPSPGSPSAAQNTDLARSLLTM